VRNLIAHYSDYYADDDGSLAEWRHMGAVDKAENVMRLWDTSPTPARVAEVGCGDGSIMVELARRSFGGELVGYEISESGAEATRANGFRCEVFDGAHLPAEDKEYDLAILSHVVEHLADPRSLIAEAARVAAFVFVEVPLELNMRTAEHWQWTQVGHVNLFNPLLLRHLVESCGLTIQAEQVTQPSLEFCRFRLGRARGTALWAAKRALLAAKVGGAVCTYHGSLLAAPSH
jgi:SAM-dependent methyltransferase